MIKVYKSVFRSFRGALYSKDTNGTPTFESFSWGNQWVSISMFSYWIGNIIGFSLN